jgi:hypothetical protein
MASRGMAGPGWRLMGEFAQPPGSQDEQWVGDGLTAAWEVVHLLSPDRERVKDAAIAAVRRAGGCRATLASLGQPLTVRLLISGTLEAGLASGGWGFFVLERATGGDGTDAGLDSQGQPVGRCIELYLYTDCGAA